MLWRIARDAVIFAAIGLAWLVAALMIDLPVIVTAAFVLAILIAALEVYVRMSFRAPRR